MSLPSAWKDHLIDLEQCKPWPRYYHFRADEMAVVEALCPLPHGGTLLELGCGNAFHSYLLSEKFDCCIATDLYGTDASTHTIGLERARSLAGILGFKHLRIVGASACALPFADSSIDFVFSSNVLEHVPDQERAVAEIYRVLRPGGACLTIVPAAMERIYNLPVSYIRILHSMVLGLRSHRQRRRAGQGEMEHADAGGPSTAPAGVSSRARGFFRKHYPGFPFPRPHGEYHSSTEEFQAHRPSRWEALMRTQPFQVERRFTTILAPHVLGMGVSLGAAYWVARSGAWFTKRCGDVAPFRLLGTSCAFLVRKPEDDSP